MYPEQFQAIIAIFLHINGLAFGQLNSQADVINNCSSSTSCIRTYDQVYQSLTKSDNSYNISYALYPGRLNPSSVRVFVNVYGLGPYKSKNSVPAQYTWSMSCLYATIPSRILELLSFGTILVTPRTQELNLQIPLFCCNVSEDKGGRKRIIHEMLTRAIADLQDLAVSPGIRDPKLNTAECVIQGHEPNISDPGVSPYVKPILWCSFFSVLLLGPIIAFIALDLLKPHRENCICCANSDDHGDGLQFQCKYCCCDKRFLCYNRERPLICSANILCHLFLLCELIIVVILYSLTLLEFNNVPLEIYIPVFSFIFEGIVICSVQCFFMSECCHFCNDAKDISFYRRCIFIACTNLILYHLCWVVVGIMINPAWGLIIFVIVGVVGVASLYSLEQICLDISEGSPLPTCLTFPAIFIGLCLFAVMAVLAGQSFSGRETADDVMKTALFFVVGVIISWKFKKRQSSPQNETQNGNDHNPAPSGSREEYIKLEVVCDTSSET